MGLEEIIRSNSLNFTGISLIAILVLVIFSKLFKDRGEGIKYLLFGSLVLVILANTAYLFSSTLYLNNVSLTKGPVHWHADFQIWECGNEIELIDPTGLSNKIGTATLHEHNDKRIHVEGVVVTQKEVSLGKFFEVVGGKLENNQISVPTESGVVNRMDGDVCSDGNIGYLQGFVFKSNEEEKVFHQEKLDNPADYFPSPHSQVPPGDCIILEFGAVKDKTDKLCEQYQVKVNLGEYREVF